MVSIKEAAAEFLAHRRIAVTGVSRTPRGMEAMWCTSAYASGATRSFAVNLNADEVEGDTCYHDLKSIPGSVQAVVIGTRPELAEETVRECADLGIGHVWMHRSFGKGSVSGAATEYGRTHGITVIDGGCPLTFEPTADGPHKVMRFVFSLTGKVPRTCEASVAPRPVLP